MPSYMNPDLSHFLDAGRGLDVSFRGRYPEEFLVRPRPETIPAWHLVGGKDPVDACELDGYGTRRRLPGTPARLDSAATA